MMRRLGWLTLVAALALPAALAAVGDGKAGHPTAGEPCCCPFCCHDASCPR